MHSQPPFSNPVQLSIVFLSSSWWNALIVPYISTQLQTSNQSTLHYLCYETMQIVCLASSRRTLQLSEWRDSSPCLVHFQENQAVIYKTWVFILSVHLHFFLTWLRSMGDEAWEVIPLNLFQIYIFRFSGWALRGTQLTTSYQLGIRKKGASHCFRCQGSQRYESW